MNRAMTTNMRGELVQGKLLKERWSFQLEKSRANGAGNRAGFLPDNFALSSLENAHFNCTVKGG
jgi:hypothetical protein